MTKAERTRRQLRTIALELMRRDGYDATTVDQIAAAAGVSPMTFFRHFPSKDAVVLDDPYDADIGACVAAQPAGLPVLERVRRGLLAAWERLPEPEHEETRIRVGIVAATPQLRARSWDRTAATQRSIVESLAETGVDRLPAEVAAGACLGALEAALLDWGRSGDGTLGERVSLALAILAPDRNYAAGVRLG